MSSLLTADEFGRAREAVSDGTVTDELYRWLFKLVALAQATKTLAPAPVPNGNWNDPDAVAETVHAWLADSLLRGALLQAFDTCRTPRALSRYLERSLRNWLIARSRRRSGPRLLQRAAELLAQPPFVIVRAGQSVMDRWWALEVWDSPELYEGGDGAVISAAWAVADLEPLRFSSSERNDPVLSTEDLRRFLQELLSRLRAALNGRHLDRAFRHRFAYAYAAPTLDLDEAPELAGGPSPETEVAVADAARVALGVLTGRQLRVLLTRPERTLEELAAELGVSRGTVDNEYRRALLKVREATPTDDEFDAVLEKVVQMASKGVDG